VDDAAFGPSCARARTGDFTFTPKHGSWLNLIEGFFSKFARSVLRHTQMVDRTTVSPDGMK
jgi:hypothetical protein